MAESMFSKLPEDILLNIFFKLEDDPRIWARLACVSTKFSSLIRNICWKSKCSQSIPSLVADLLAGDSAPAGGWASLYKLAVCCPGMVHSGVLLENSDFGLERELGPDENYLNLGSSQPPRAKTEASPPESEAISDFSASGSDCPWSLHDDLYFDTVYNDSELMGDGVTMLEFINRGWGEGATTPFTRRLTNAGWNGTREKRL